jgi:multiple sugar transport system permease protein
MPVTEPSGASTIRAASIPVEPDQRGRGRSTRASRRRLPEALWGYLLVAPIGLGLAVFNLWPVAQTAYYSLTEWGPFGGSTWIGVDNYRTLMADAEVRRALLNTLTYTALTLLGIPIAIFVAALLNRRGLRGATIYRTLFFIPVITMPVAVAMVWRWLYNGEYGLINHVLSMVGINGPHWISDPATALYALVVVGIWSLLGYQVVIFLAGLQAISREYYEAAEMDGAGWFTQFRHITVPLLTPSIFFVSVITVIGSLQLFDLVYIMSGGGTSARANPAFSSTQTIVYLFYSKAFVTNDRGYAAAIVMALLLLIIAFTALQFRMQRRWVHYE